jgi:signal transduction histidine kinase/ActR/RegA family two-component response regulator
MQKVINWFYIVAILAGIGLCGFTYYNYTKSTSYTQNYFFVLKNIRSQKSLVLRNNNYSTRYIRGGSPSLKEKLSKKISDVVEKLRIAHDSFEESKDFGEIEPVLYEDELSAILRDYLRSYDRFIKGDSKITDKSIYLKKALKISNNTLIPILDSIIKGYTEGYEDSIASYNKSQLTWLMGIFGAFGFLILFILLPISKKAAKSYDLLQEKNRIKAEFISSVSRQFHRQINNIIGTTDVLLDTQLSDEQRKNAYTITNAAGILLNSTNDIIAFQNIEEGNMVVEKVSFNMKAAIEEMYGLLSVDAENKNIKLSTEIADNLPEIFIGDIVRIKQILFNLVSNAVHFTNEGEVKIRVENTPTDNDNKGRAIEIKFSVIDTGIGINKETQKTIFDNFIHPDSESHDDGGSYGLGLGMTKLLVQTLGGKIGVESEEGKGSIFWFILPLNIDNSPQEVHFDGLKVLLAEDNRVSREFTSRMLGNIGCEVTTAENGEIAVNKAKETKFDIILMDCEMPVMDGFEATRKIRELIAAKEAEQTIIVALTGNILEEDKERCTEAGMDNYFSKPVHKEDYISMLNKCLNR